MTPTELWEEFESAYYQSTSHRTFEDDEHEFGQPLPYGKLKKRYDTVINYWLDPKTFGGHILHNSGYIDAVCPEVLEMVEEYQRRLKVAKKHIIKEVFSNF